MIGIFSVGALLVAVGVAAFFILRTTPEQAEVDPPVSFPNADPSDIRPTDVPLVEVPTADGGSVVIRDFLKSETTIEDVQNPGVYYLAGSPEYCLMTDDCPAAAELPGANIIFNTAYGSFTVALLEEPLSDARHRAEQFLLNTLGTDQTGLCALNIYVGTDSYVNDSFAGTNLGLSFCPGAVVLP